MNPYSPYQQSDPANNGLGRYPMRRLQDVGVRILDCEHRTPNFLDSGFPYIAIPSIRDGRIDLSGVSMISHIDLESWTRRTKPQAGDIIITRRGRVGDTGVVPPGLTCAIGQNLVIARSAGEEIDQGYLRWVLRGPRHEQEVAKWLNVGAVFDSLNVRDIPKFEIPVPPIPVQRAIAHILGTLDDKIELNRRMNRTLEEMARALFRSWFVDFDPVRAKAVGREPEGMDAETAALFPSELEGSELGEIPEGWTVEPIGKLVEVFGGATPSTSEPAFWSGTIPFATPRDLSKVTAAVLLQTERHVTELGLRRIASGIVPKGSVLMSSRAPIGYLAICDVDVVVNQGIIAMVCSKGVPNDFAMLWAREHMDVIVGNANGSTFLEISKRDFRSIPVLRPSAPVLDAFSALVGSMFAMLTNNLHETVSLSSVRDSLLPKLLSGEVAARNIGEVEGSR